MKKFYTQNEEKEILHDIKLEKRMKYSDTKILMIFLCFFAFLASSFVMQGKFLPDTWRCRNCGYENYEGIGRCAICGEKRR